MTKILHCLVTVHSDKFVSPAVRISMTFHDLGLIPGFSRPGKMWLLNSRTFEDLNEPSMKPSLTFFLLYLLSRLYSSVCNGPRGCLRLTATRSPAGSVFIQSTASNLWTPWLSYCVRRPTQLPPLGRMRDKQQFSYSFSGLTTLVGCISELLHSRFTRITSKCEKFKWQNTTLSKQLY